MWRKGRKRKGNQKGVTLLEVVIALALFAIIVTPVAKSFLTAMKVNQRSRETMIATDVAQSIMEGISGKTYEDVCKALDIAPTGFDFTATHREDNGKYALSSINDGYYNCGGETGRVFEVVDFPASVTGITPQGIASWPTTTSAGVPITLDKAMTINACMNLQIARMVGASACLPPYGDVWTNDGVANDIFTNDKCLFFGQSAETYGGRPLVTYLLYTRIQKDNQFFDATVTFVPHSHDVNVATPGDVDEYFTYEVTVSVYPYEYDPTTGTFIGRFEPDYYIEGAPAAVMKSGIQNKE
ncbi:MAG: prepilin-type N-terminal cleavage/methylation domain-containing protein [Lachnospiraceae bacterium]|nr:prepilin-type N-terminal cleavage/methylation domain-containing protein [Lachnospiraceae bacterium]